MVTPFNSVPDTEDLSLKNYVSRIQRSPIIEWKLVSGTASDDGSFTAEFESKIKNSDRKYHLATLVSPHGESHHYSVI